MASQEDALAAAVEELAVEACFASLPLALLLVIFALLPVDQRMRCAEVCRGWRTALLERSLWTQLDLSEASGGLARPASEGLLRAAAARAGGKLHLLDVSKCEGITHACLLAVLAANAGALRELRTWRGGACYLELDAAQALLRAAPQLRVFDADVECEGVAEAQRMLRNEGAWAPLRLRKLRVVFDAQTEAAVLSLAVDLAAYDSLLDLSLIYAPLDTPAALDAIVAVALAKRFSALTLFNCSLSPASAPALARLLGGGALRSLDIVNDNAPLLDAAAAAVLGDVLRANRALKSLMLLRIGLWRDPAVAVTLLGAVTAHRSLRSVSLNSNPVGDAQDAAGAALGALLAANAPALLTLNLIGVVLGTVTTSAAFMRDRLLPAVRANTSLTSLMITVTGEGESAAFEVEEILDSRRAAR
jgi:hypothetical protein